MRELQRNYSMRESERMEMAVLQCTVEKEKERDWICLCAFLSRFKKKTFDKNKNKKWKAYIPRP